MFILAAEHGRAILAFKSKNPNTWQLIFNSQLQRTEVEELHKLMCKAADPAFGSVSVT